MKALTISQPFASLIADGEKWVENRTWETLYRGPLLIHAGKGQQYLTRKELVDYPTSCIVAVAELTACVHIDQSATRSGWRKSPRGCGKKMQDIDAHEYTLGPFCWILEDVQPLATPQPATGRQGLWKFAGPCDTPLAEAIMRLAAQRAELLRK